MEKSVFDCEDYRSYLLSRLGAAGKRTGLRSQACAELGCHSTYLSQVLCGKTEISLEYAEAFNKFFRHSADEGNFFLLLLLRDRAGSTSLKERFQKQIEDIRKSRSTLKKRLVDSGDVSISDQNQFYGTWLYGALHILVTLPHLKTKPQLAEALGVSEAKASQAIDFLERIGLLVTTKSGYQIGTRHVHLNADSLLIAKHHTNWRFHAIQSLESASSDDLHYSGAVSLSKVAALTIRENLLRAFQENMRLVRDAKEEVAYVYNFDFYRLDR